MRDGSIGLSQRGLIDTIIQDADLQDSKVKAVPAKVNEHVHAHLDKPPFSLNFNYRSMVSKLNYLAQTTRPDIMYATHQLAKYSSNPREPHGDAALYLVRYLKKSRDIGLRFTPDPEKGFECNCDANFSEKIGTSNSLVTIQVLRNPAADGLFSTQVVLSFGHLAFRLSCPIDY